MFWWNVMLVCILFNKSTGTVLGRKERLNLCPVDLCTCTGNTVVCKNGEHILEYIPQFPPNIEIVDFSGQNLKFIESYTFYNISTLKITKLSLANNGIQYISIDAFSKLQYLTFLDLTSNKLLDHSVLRDSFSSLKFSGSGTLVLNKMNIMEKDMTNLFEYLETTNVTLISLEYNDFVHIDSCFFVEFQHLQILKLSNNRLKTITFNCSITTLQLEIDSNDLEFVPKLCLPTTKTTSVPHLQELSLSNNKITVLDSNSFLCCKSLRKLKLFKNPFMLIGKNSFHHFQRLHFVEISSLYQNYRNVLQNFTFSSSCIEHISLRNFSLNGVEKAFHGSLPCSATLDVSYNVLPSDISQLKVLYQPFYNITSLVTRSVTWTKIPYSILSKTKKLRLWDFSSNALKIINATEFTKIISYFGLETLNMSNCSIEYINGFSLPDFATSSLLPVAGYQIKLKVLDLSNNAFSCSCSNTNSLLTFFKTLRNQNVSIVSYPESYVCASPKEYKGKTINTVVCRPNVDTILYIILLTISMCVCMSTIAFKSRYRLRYWIYILTRKRIKKQRTIEKSQAYDAFVIYSEEDRKWLFSHFLPFIEEQNGYKLCIHSRDFKYGRLIVDNIVENMNNSRKIVMIVSQNFVNSRWCMFEVLLAHERFLQSGPDSLVSIKLEELTNISMTNTLETLIKFATHAVWTADDHNREEFWVKILDCLQIESVEAQKMAKVVNDSGTENSTDDKEKSEGKQNKYTSSNQEIDKDDVKKILSEICFQMNSMSDTMNRRLDNFEESIKKDISSLTDKVHEIEAKLSLLQNDRPEDIFTLNMS